MWEEFQRRFRIPQILEFYAATEANVSLFNVEGKPGVIGRMPPFIAKRDALALVKFDVRTACPCAMTRAFACGAARTRSAKRSAASPQVGLVTAGGSTATRTR